MKDIKREIKRKADFLGIQCTESTIKEIADTTSFQNMQQHKRDPRGFIYRKGNIFLIVHKFYSNSYILFCL